MAIQNHHNTTSIAYLNSISYQKFNAACAGPNIAPTKTPINAQTKSCFSFSCPLDLSRMHFNITPTNVSIVAHMTGKKIIRKIVISADVSIFKRPSKPIHFTPLRYAAVILSMNSCNQINILFIAIRI